MNALDLSQLSDKELTDKIKSNEDVGQSLGVLQQRHSGIFHQKVDGYSGVMEINDLRENPMTFFYECATSFDGEKAKFPTWLGRKADWKCKNIFRKNKNGEEIHENMASESPHLGRSELYTYVLERIEDDVDREILRKRMEGMTYKEIGESLVKPLTYERIRQRFNLIIERYQGLLQEEIK